MRSKIITYPGVMKNRYTVSDTGIVIDTKTNTICPQYINSGGYYGVSLDLEQSGHCLFSISRLVAYEFNENSNLSLQVDHINGDKSDNRIENLEWVDQSENIKRSYLSGKRKHKPNNSISSQNTKMVIDRNLSNDELHCICETLQDYPDICYDRVFSMNNIFSCNSNKIKNICSGLVNGKYHLEISSNYDFSQRLSRSRRTLNSLYKKQLYDCYIKNNCSPKETFEEFEGKSWDSQSRKEKDKFYHIINRIKASRGSSTIP